MNERSWEGAAHEYEEQARFARAERDVALARIAELETERDKHKGNAERLYASLTDLSTNARPALDRIAELEVERSALIQEHIKQTDANIRLIRERDRLREARDLRVGASMSDNTTLVERVKQFNTMSLPGQPLGWHMGTGYLVNDLAARIAELEAERNRLRFACEVISNGETSSPIDMANAALENGDTLRWLDRLSIGEAYAYRSEDHGPGKKP